ncbi:MAG: T9SS type A sorting domain-containing protein [Saprospiraceae bacterium]|nr:T9SS type A sorting domain-containing protein [Saprospiraceae bacterium]
MNDSTSVPGAEEAFQNGLIWGMNPKFQDSLSGDFRLAACSPAVDKGNDMIVIDQNLLTDLDSLPRIRYSAVDIGAYEQQDSCVNVSLVVPSNSFPLTIKPNPSPDGILHFGTPLSQSELGWICIVDMQGRIVFENQIELWPMNSVSLQDLSPGIYLVLVSTEKQEFRGMWIRG